MVSDSHNVSRLAACWLPVFTRAQSLFQQAAGQDAATLSAAVVELIDQAVQRSREGGHPESDIDAAKFAVVAWLDETAMRLQWPGALAWRLAPLQKKFFATTRAGVEFFQRFETLPHDAVDVREVFGLALAAGFQGHYGLGRPDELAAYRQQALADLLRETRVAPVEAGRPLFPQTHASHGPAGQYRRRAQPVLASIWLLVVPVLVLIAAYLIFDTMLASKVAALIEKP